MNTDKWTIVHHTKAPQSLQELFPKAVSHDGVNKVYVAYDPGFSTLDLADIDDQQVVLAQAAQALVKETPITLTPSQAQNLFMTPHHRLWCSRYEDDMGLLAQDYESVTGTPMPEGFTPEQGRELVFNMFSGAGVEP